ncbi:hypothetical protein CapIbe_020448 [Capra ibex]
METPGTVTEDWGPEQGSGDPGLGAQTHSSVDHFCDKMGNEPEEAQMEAALAETEEKLNEDFYEFLEDKIQENLPESLQESSPLLQEARQEVPHRIQRPSVSACLELFRNLIQV